MALADAGSGGADVQSPLFFVRRRAAAAELERRWAAKFGLPIHQGYGLTETSPFAAYNHVTQHRSGWIGAPIEGVEMAVADVADGHRLGPGEMGEIIIKGPNVMLGYWNRPAETQEAIQDGWFHTGDLGRIDSEGYFYIEDRLKDMAIVGGSNVYPAEVENALYQHPAVAEAAVYGMPHATLGESVRATVVRRPGASVTADELMSHCRERLARYKLPAAIEFAASLPKTGAGKVLKRVLRSSATAAPQVPIVSVPELERRICGWMARELGAPPSGIDPGRAFADYGFTSLMAVQLAAALQQWLSRDMAATMRGSFRARARWRGTCCVGGRKGSIVPSQMAAWIAALSDDEADLMLANELGRLQSAAAGGAEADERGSGGISGQAGAIGAQGNGRLVLPRRASRSRSWGWVAAIQARRTWQASGGCW